MTTFNCGHLTLIVTFLSFFFRWLVLFCLLFDAELYSLSLEDYETLKTSKHNGKILLFALVFFNGVSSTASTNNVFQLSRTGTLLFCDNILLWEFPMTFCLFLQSLLIIFSSVVYLIFSVFVCVTTSQGEISGEDDYTKEKDAQMRRQREESQQTKVKASSRTVHTRYNPRSTGELDNVREARQRKLGSWTWAWSSDGWMDGSSDGWMDWSIDWWIDWSIDWLMDWLIHVFNRFA